MASIDDCNNIAHCIEHYEETEEAHENVIYEIHLFRFETRLANECKHENYLGMGEAVMKCS